MSRSYKKHLVCKDSDKWHKTKANRKARSLFKRGESASGKSGFKKLYDSWEISDYVEYGTSFDSFYKKQLKYWEDGCLYWWKDKKSPPPKKECWKVYNRLYRRK